MSYKFIINPQTNKKIFLNSKKGINIIKNYIKKLKGGATKVVICKGLKKGPIGKTCHPKKPGCCLDINHIKHCEWKKKCIKKKKIVVDLDTPSSNTTVVDITPSSNNTTVVDTPIDLDLKIPILKRLNGPISFWFYKNVLGKRILLLGDKHNLDKDEECKNCNKPNCYNVQDYLYELAKNTPEEIAYFIEESYIRKDLHLKYTLTRIEKAIANQNSFLAKVSNKFINCFNKKDKSLCKKEFPKLNYNSVDLRTGIKWNNEKKELEIGFTNIFAIYLPELKPILKEKTNEEIDDFTDRFKRGFEFYYDDEYYKWKDVWNITESERLQVIVDYVKQYSDINTIKKLKNKMGKEEDFISNIFYKNAENNIHSNDIGEYLLGNYINNLFYDMFENILEAPVLKTKRIYRLINVIGKMEIEDYGTLNEVQNEFLNKCKKGLKKSYTKTRKQLINIKKDIAKKIIKSYKQILLDELNLESILIAEDPVEAIATLIADIYIDLYTIGRIFRNYKDKSDKNIIVYAGNLHIIRYVKIIRDLNKSSPDILEFDLDREKCIEFDKPFNFYM